MSRSVKQASFPNADQSREGWSMKLSSTQDVSEKNKAVKMKGLGRLLGAKTSGVSFFLISEVSGPQDPEANQRVGCMAGQGTWSSTTFKPLNLVNASGVPSVGGHLHPLNKARNSGIAHVL